ncbi:MAG TPA: hypothetical protein VKW78_23220 [Terriglobales bacterium]|nr:hypothetical protein [Terriglobales bacterium]
MSPKELCENTKVLGYDPTGESALLCNEPGEYCSQCEMVLCDTCHAQVANHAMAAKKPPATVIRAERERRARGR